MYEQVGDFHVSRGFTQGSTEGRFTTVPLTQISCNTFFSKYENARKAGTLCIWYLAHAYLIFGSCETRIKKIFQYLLGFQSFVFLAHTHFSQSKKTHEPRTCCSLFSALVCCSYVYVAIAYWYIFCYIIEFHDTNSASKSWRKFNNFKT